MAQETYRWCDNNDCLWVSWCSWSAQYSLVVSSCVGHTDSFLWDCLWLQPVAGPCVLRPHSHTCHAFLIVRVQMGHTVKKWEKRHQFYQTHTVDLFVFVLLGCFVCILNVHQKTQNAANNKSCEVGGTSQPNASSPIGADESQYYIMRLALA